MYDEQLSYLLFPSAEETLVGKATGEDGKGRDVLLRSRVDPTSGGLCWLPVDATVAAEGLREMIERLEVRACILMISHVADRD